MIGFKKTATMMPVIAATFLAGCLGDVSDDKIAEVVEKTLMNKPEIIIEALNSYREKEQVKKADEQKAVLENSADELFNDKHSLVLGNPDGDVTLVAFKDYRCGYCKKSWPIIQELIKTDKDLKIVFKEFPVLGPESELASRYALASSLQGDDKYKAFNDDLMNHRGPWDVKTLKKLAAKHNIDGDKLDTEAGGKFVTDAIMANRKLGQGLAIQGTPAFVLGDQVIPGAVPLDFLQDAIQKERMVEEEPAAEE